MYMEQAQLHSREQMCRNTRQTSTPLTSALPSINTHTRTMSSSLSGGIAKAQRADRRRCMTTTLSERLPGASTLSLLPA